MYLDKTVCAVIPCYNEQSQIGEVLDTMPDFVDYIIVVDDSSLDNTVQVVRSHPSFNNKTSLIQHKYNQGVGGAIASGYKWCASRDVDVAVVMAGDGQMSPVDLPNIIAPVARGEVDYAKGNRLIVGQAYKTIPASRFFGNTILSLLTKIASGYWHISDSQTGYTAIGRIALKLINWDKMYKRYGQPNDLLVRLNVADLRVVDVPMQPVYNVGEKSGIKIKKVIPTISMLLIKQFLWRLKEKYIMRGLHPLIFFYLFAATFVGISSIFLIRILYFAITFQVVPELSLLLFLFAAASAFNSLFFAMLLDYNDNKDLNPRVAYSSLERYFK